MPNGSGPMRDRAASANAAVRADAPMGKVEYSGFANFIAHVMEWGLRCVLAESFTLETLTAYIYQLTRVSEVAPRGNKL